jgi:hypothetical protein
MADDPTRLLDTLVAATRARHAARATVVGPTGALEPYTVLHAADDAIAASGQPLITVLAALMAATTIRPDQLDAESALDWASWSEVQEYLARTLLADEVWRRSPALAVEDERRATACAPPTPGVPAGPPP